MKWNKPYNYTTVEGKISQTTPLSEFLIALAIAPFLALGLVGAGLAVGLILTLAGLL